MSYMLTLGHDLRLDTNQMFLAEVIGLFHDVGRFEQYAKYHTFKDHQSEDHSELGLSVLERGQIFLGRVSELEKEIIKGFSVSRRTAAVALIKGILKVLLI